jgi:YbbR domain-containing protein
VSNELERRPDSAIRRGGKRGKAVIFRLWHMLRHNLGWKILALFLAVALWAGLITQDPSLTREKSFTDVPVTISGADTLKRNGLIVTSDLTANPPAVRLKVDVPQKEYNNVTAGNYNVRIDLSRIIVPGVQEVRISASSTSAYGSVVEIYPDTIKVDVEKYDTSYRIPVTLSREGELPSNFYSSSPSVEPPTVAISGPKSLVDRVSRAVATYDQSTLPAREGPVSFAVPFILVDAAGAQISSDLIDVTSESVLLKNVILEQTLYNTRIIDLSQAALTTGTPDDGYQVKSVSVTPSQIVAAGRSESLSQIDNLFLESPVNVDGRTESFTDVIKVRQPAEIENLSSTSVTVTVEIEPVNTNRSFDNLHIDTLGLADGLALAVDKSRASVTISGPKLWVDSLKASGVTLSADLTGLKEGVYNVPLLCTVTDSEQIKYTYATDPAIVQVTLTSK